jgi:hypothetical protein
LRRRTDASAAILRFIRDGGADLLSNVPLAQEYESICVGQNTAWRPQLRDPNDEMVLETAVTGQADAIVTFNMGDFGEAPGRFGIELFLPQAALKRLRQ